MAVQIKKRRCIRLKREEKEEKKKENERLVKLIDFGK